MATGLGSAVSPKLSVHQAHAAKWSGRVVNRWPSRGHFFASAGERGKSMTVAQSLWLFHSKAPSRLCFAALVGALRSGRLNRYRTTCYVFQSPIFITSLQPPPPAIATRTPYPQGVHFIFTVKQSDSATAVSRAFENPLRSSIGYHLDHVHSETEPSCYV